MLRATCEYGFTTALGRLDMEFTPGAVYGIEGRNGSGKTTLLRTLAGELDPLKRGFWQGLSGVCGVAVVLCGYDGGGAC